MSGRHQAGLAIGAAVVAAGALMLGGGVPYLFVVLGLTLSSFAATDAICTAIRETDE